MRGVDPLLDEEALRVVKGIPGKWVPGREKGKKVPVSYTIPVSFRLSGENNSSSSNEGLKVNKNIKAFFGRSLANLYSCGTFRIRKV